jgi:hypothetical protein
MQPKTAPPDEQDANNLFERAVIAVIERYLSEHQSQVAFVQRDDDEGIDAKEVARMLGYYKKTGEPNPWPIYELAKRNIIKSFRPSPRIVRFQRGVIRKFVESGGYAEPAVSRKKGSKK